MNRKSNQMPQTAKAQARRRWRIGVAVLLAFLGSLSVMQVFRISESPLQTMVAVAGSISATLPEYPVKLGPTGRYLVDQNNLPFLIAGESPQAMIGNLSEADAELFFANRQSHGFNTVYIDLLCNDHTGCRFDGRTFDGIAPFTALLSGSSAPNYDLTTPNEAYFARVDRILQLAAQYGLLVMLNPAETTGWLSVMQSNGVTNSRAYGQFLGERYASFDNILWLHGNDYNFEQLPTSAMDAVTTAVALGISDFDNRHLQTVQLYFPVSSSLEDATWAPLIQLNAAYTYEPTYKEVLKDYNRSDFLPTFMVEASYEFEQNRSTFSPGIPQVLRRQEYWSNLSGATGQLYGNHYTWAFFSGWKNKLDTPGAIQMAYVTALFEPRAWHNLVPDQDHTVVTAGYGTFGDNDYVTAARTPDGTLVMAYVPTVRTVRVDMSQLSGLTTARWYDPANGTFTDIAGSPFANTGSLSFPTPGNNADGPGNEDWVLVLEVLGNSAPLTLSGLALPDAEAGVSYSAPLVTGGLAPYTFNLVKGTFPAGLSPDLANGRLVGTPTLAKGGKFTVKITDQLNSSVTGAFNIQVLGALGISTTALKAGTHGKAYKGALKARGGKTPYSWSLAFGSLPTGLTQDSSTGAITGIPTQVGAFNATFQVTDPAGGNAQKNFTLTIN